MKKIKEYLKWYKDNYDVILILISSFILLLLTLILLETLINKIFN